jgi:hypothetical protein
MILHPLKSIVATIQSNETNWSVTDTNDTLFHHEFAADLETMGGIVHKIIPMPWILCAFRSAYLIASTDISNIPSQQVDKPHLDRNFIRGFSIGSLLGIVFTINTSVFCIDHILYSIFKLKKTNDSHRFSSTEYYLWYFAVTVSTIILVTLNRTVDNLSIRMCRNYKTSLNVSARNGCSPIDLQTAQPRTDAGTVLNSIHPRNLLFGRDHIHQRDPAYLERPERRTGGISQSSHRYVSSTIPSTFEA